MDDQIVSVSWPYMAGKPAHEKLEPATMRMVTYREWEWRLPFPRNPNPDANAPSPERQYAWAADILMRLDRVGIAGRADHLPEPATV